MNPPDWSEPTLRLLEIGGTWIAGIGSLAAVYVAIRLASWDQRIHLRVTATVGIKINHPGVSHSDEFLWVRVINIGRRPATLRSIGMRAGLLPQWSPVLPRHYGVLLFDQAEDSTPLPTTLQDGQSANFWMPMERAAEIVPAILNRPYWLAARLLRVSAEDAASGEQYVSPTPSLRQRLLAAAKARSPTEAAAA